MKRNSINNMSTQQLNFITLINLQSNEHYKDILIEFLTSNTYKYMLEMDLIQKDKEMEFQLNMKDKEIISLYKEMEFKLNMKDKKNYNKILKSQRLEKEIELAKLRNIYN